jgi:hypothetical protein
MVRAKLSALLAASGRSDVLDKPIQAGISNTDAWPHKEHESLKMALLESDFFTDLMQVLQYNEVVLRDEISHVPADQREDFKTKHDNALTYRIEGTTTNKGSLYSFDLRLKRIQVLVVQHVQDCLQILRPTQREKSMFTSAQASSGAVSQDAHLRIERRLHSMVTPILAKSLLVPGTNENAEVLELIMKENNLKGLNAYDQLKTVTQAKVTREALAYKKALEKMRELFTYYLLWSFGILCPQQTVDQLKVLQQQHFLSPAYKAADDHVKPSFTAIAAIAYLRKECHTGNGRTITAINRK